MRVNSKAIIFESKTKNAFWNSDSEYEIIDNIAKTYSVNDNIPHLASFIIILKDERTDNLTIYTNALGDEKHYLYRSEYNKLIHTIVEAEMCHESEAAEFIEDIIDADDVYDYQVHEFGDKYSSCLNGTRSEAVMYELAFRIEDDKETKDLMIEYLNFIGRMVSYDSIIEDRYGFAVFIISIFNLSFINSRLILGDKLKNRVNSILENPKGYEEVIHTIRTCIRIYDSMEDLEYLSYGEDYILKNTLALLLIVEDVSRKK